MPKRSPSLEPRLVDNRYRVALPKEVREQLGVGKGDYITFAFNDDGEVCIRRLIITVAPTL